MVELLAWFSSSVHLAVTDVLWLSFFVQKVFPYDLICHGC